MKKKLRLAYLGSPDFAAYFLEKLLTDKDIPVEVKLVITQEDKKAGRKQVLTASPVKIIAQKFKIPVSSNLAMQQLNNIDLALLYAYGEILPKDLLMAPKLGFWNIHPSLLPLYRGPSPVATALIDGQKQTGVTIMKITEKLDSGPIIAQKSVDINPKERLPELSMRLAKVGYELFNETITQLTSSPHFAKASGGRRVNELKTTEQNEKKATYTKKITKQDGFIELKNLESRILNQPNELFNLFRGLYPWPGLWTLIRFKNKDSRLKITDMDLINGALIIKKVQLEGKREVDFKIFNEVYRVF